MSSFSPRTTDLDLAARLSTELGIHPVTAQILVGRGVLEAKAARSFLQPGSSQLHDPGEFKDMDRATAMLADACRSGARVGVYGDFDVDGVSGTAVLVRTLSLFGCETRPFIPHRIDDGYGLNGASLTRLKTDGCRLVVTVDNGTSRPQEIADAKAAGLEIIVTDHHEPGKRVPDCPLINPKRTDTTYPFSGLAGCAVAFKVALALAQRLGRLESEAFQRLLPDLMALVALGTVADVVPLQDENRSLVALGLKALAQTPHAGLRALLDVSRCGRRAVRTADISFRLGPRINAAGRIASAHKALDLLLCEDPKQAAALARELDLGNRERQRIERQHADDALERAAAEDGPAVVLAGADWHPGVIGIVAARVAERFRKPAVMIAISGPDARGSARSFGGVRLHEALDACADHLTTHGGHAFAAGFTMPADRIDGFRRAFLDAVGAQDMADPGLREVDAELPLEAVTASLAAEINLLQPFGRGNEEPVFCTCGLRAAGRVRRTGPQDRHLLFHAATDRASVRAIAFHQADQAEILKGSFDLAYVIRTRPDGEPVELHVRQIVPS